MYATSSCPSARSSRSREPIRSTSGRAAVGSGGVDSFDAGRLAALDEEWFFRHIETQSNPNDRRSWLALQRAIRPGGYAYLEIGSHLGGSIQQHVIDPLCERIYSIDPRPDVVPDDRGFEFEYQGNSTARMMSNLTAVTPLAETKIATFDSDARDVPMEILEPKPLLCFVDGQHTKDAVVSDFGSCLRAVSDGGAICFHDDNVVWPALVQVESMLRATGTPHTLRKLPGTTFAVMLDGCTAISDPYIRDHGVDGRWWLVKRRVKHSRLRRRSQVVWRVVRRLTSR